MDDKIIEFEAMTENAQFFAPKSPAVLVTGKPLIMIVYGWNDEIAVNTGDIRVDTVEYSYGGLIVKLARGATGMPMGVYDETLEWSEARATCGTQKPVSEWTEDVILSCKNNTFCDTSSLYSMYTAEWEGGQTHVVNSRSDGTSDVKMWLRDSSYNKVSVYECKGVPYHLMGNIFEPVADSSTVEKDLCTFWFLPYDLLEQLIISCATSDAAESPIAIATAWKWQKDCYDRKVESIIKSMKSMSQRLEVMYL